MGMSDDEILELARQDRPISREELGIRYPSEEGFNILPEGILYDADKAEMINSTTPIEVISKDQYESRLTTDMATIKQLSDSVKTLQKANSKIAGAYDKLKSDYENHLKADMVAMLTELQSEIREYHEIGCNEDCNNCRMVACIEPKDVIKDLDIVQQKINELKGEET